MVTAGHSPPSVFESCQSVWYSVSPTYSASFCSAAYSSTRTIRGDEMKAIVQDVYGSADVLELRNIDRPPIGDEEVLVQVHAAGVDPGVWHLMAGEPYLIRPMGFGLRTPKVKVRGRDVAGVVVAAGARVTRFRAGDEVYGTCESGSFAEYAAAPEKRLAAKPASLSFEQAAAVPIS